MNTSVIMVSFHLTNQDFGQMILLLVNYEQLPITSTVLLKKILARKLEQYFSTRQRLSIGFGMKV